MSRHTSAFVWCLPNCMIIAAAHDAARQQEPVIKTYLNLHYAEVEGRDRNVLSAATAFGLSGDDPIVLTGRYLQTLRGSAVDRIVAFRFHNGWEQIPVQIDERELIEIGAYTVQLVVSSL